MCPQTKIDILTALDFSGLLKRWLKIGTENLLTLLLKYN